MPNIAFVTRMGSRLLPADKASEEAVRAIPAGEVVRIEWSRPRNIKFHRKFFALLNAAYELQDHFDSIEAFRYWITLKAGFFETILTPNEDVILKPKSISFAKMDEDEFERLYSKVIDILLQQFGVTRQDVERIIRFA